MKRLVVLAAVALVACSDDPEWTPPPPNSPPTMAPLAALPDWPPLGPGRTLGVECTDDRGVTEIRASFLRSVGVPTRGQPVERASFRTEDLGEGQGTFRARCVDATGFGVERQIRDLLIDLTPPQIFAERLLATPNADGFEGELGFWASDAWLLGSIEITYGGKTVTARMPEAYPATLGREPDETYVAFPVQGMPDGAGDAVVVARDAAGNETRARFPVRVDARPPTVAILEPAPGAVAVGGRLPVRVSASDGGSTKPVAIVVYVGGAPVAEVTSSDAVITIDTSALAPGTSSVRAVARDEAGNTSTTPAVPFAVPVPD